MMAAVTRIGIVVLAALWAPVVSADAIPEQPECPVGASRQIDGHEVIYCKPTTCSDAPCRDGESCARRGLCVRDVSRRVASTFPPMPDDPGHEVRYREALGTCSDSTQCSDGAVCELVDRCGPRSDEPETGETSQEESGGCRVGGHADTGIALLVLALVCRRTERRM